MKHAVIIRFDYPETADKVKVEWRFSYFQSMVLPRLLSQTNKKFTIAIKTNGSRYWDERFKALSDRIITFSINPNFSDWKPEGYSEDEWKRKKERFFVDFTPWESVIGLPRFDIQTSLDSDDLVLRDDWIDTIEKHFEGKTESAHLHFYPYIFDVPSLSFYSAPFKYGKTYGSPFYSIFQPKESEEYIFVGHDSHLRIMRYMKQSEFVRYAPEDEKKMVFVAFSTHGRNESSYLYQQSKKINL